MEWQEHVRHILSQESVLNGIELDFSHKRSRLSPVIKASIVMLEKMIAAQGDKNIFVLPEIEQLMYEFLIAKVIFNISAGKIDKQYDPHSFVRGQKLKFVNCIVEFDRCEIEDGIERIYIRVKGGDRRGIPISKAPFFQAVKTNRPLSKDEAVSDALEQTDNMATSVLTTQLKNFKTHLDSSIVFVSEVKAAREFLTDAKLDGKRITDILYCAHINGNGELSNISSGQMTGNPAIIIAPDLFSVRKALINESIKVQSVIFNASIPNSIEKQLYVFDQMQAYEFPIVCITDIANSFDNEPLKDRGYNEWRWDANSLSAALINDENKRANRIIANCAKQSVKYLCVEGEDASEAMRLMNKHKSEMEEQTSVIMEVFDQLFSLAFLALRNVIELDLTAYNHYKDVLTICMEKLYQAKKYISVELYNDLVAVAENIDKALNPQKQNNKCKIIKGILSDGNNNSACLVISDKQDKGQCFQYWNSWREQNNCHTTINVMFPQEYSSISNKHFDIVVVAGWLSAKIMRNIIFHYDSEKYIVLIYSYEEKWRKPHIRAWEKILDSANNGRIIQESFSTKKNEININQFESKITEAASVSPVTDELSEIETLVQINKYKRYGRGSVSNTLVDAYPVSFIGNYMAFYTSGHHIITATDIIVNNGYQIHQVLPEALQIGDFVVVRDAQKDIIREIADTLLVKEGKQDLRVIAQKWKESLTLELVFSTPEEIYEMLKDVGCKRDFSTVKNWLTNDELITPQDKEDLLNIAAATEDEVLLEKAELIYYAGKEVKSAHTKAGKLLSERLKEKIGAELKTIEGLDQYNIWDPIVLQFDDIGTVKILKVIDIGSRIKIDDGNTNRVISEQ